MSELGHVEISEPKKRKVGTTKSRYVDEFGSDLIGEIYPGDIRELAEGWFGRKKTNGRVFYLHDSGLIIKATSSEIIINELGEIEPRNMDPTIHPLYPITNVS